MPGSLRPDKLAPSHYPACPSLSSLIPSLHCNHSCLGCLSHVASSCALCQPPSTNPAALQTAQLFQLPRLSTQLASPASFQSIISSRHLEYRHMRLPCQHNCPDPPVLPTHQPPNNLPLLLSTHHSPHDEVPPDGEEEEDEEVDSRHHQHDGGGLLVDHCDEEIWREGKQRGSRGASREKGGQGRVGGKQKGSRGKFRGEVSAWQGGR